MLKETGSSKVNTQGIGLGLVISKLIVDKFDGNIDFDSTFGKGSCFWFTFEIE
jgi:two-component system phosphate regulon sensor histidine kinase PhoR